MLNDGQLEIFLSYSWADKQFADEIDDDFKSVGITFRRDVRDIPYTGSIKEFMYKISKSDFVLMLISDEYLKSENCMYEVIELLNSHEFEQRILPVILNNANIFSRYEQEKYYDYWNQKVNITKKLLTKHTNEKTLEDKKRVQKIYDNLGEFFQKITDLKSEKYAHLKALDYKPMLDKIGLDTAKILEQALEIRKINNFEERDIAYDTLLRKYPDNKYVLFQRAYTAYRSKLYKIAKNYYEIIISKYPNYSNAYFNYAILLKKHFSDIAGAKVNYEKAIETNPMNSEAHRGLANLLQNHFFNKEKALFHFRAALELNPENYYAHNNLGSLLQEIAEFERAREHFEKAIELNPSYTYAYINLALLLKNKLMAYNDAKLYLEKAIEIAPKNSTAHYNLGLLCAKHLFDFEMAKKHFEIAISLNPNEAKYHVSLGALLEDYFSDHIQARIHTEKALEIDPDNPIAKINLRELNEKHGL